MLHSFWSCKIMAKTRHCTFESQIKKNSLLSLTDSLPVLNSAPYADATPRWPRHTTFENNKLRAKSHMSYYHSTYALYFLCCINLSLSWRIPKYVIIRVDIPSFLFPRRLRTNISKLKRLMAWSLYITQLTVPYLLASLVFSQHLSGIYYVISQGEWHCFLLLKWMTVQKC